MRPLLFSVPLVMVGLVVGSAVGPRVVTAQPPEKDKPAAAQPPQGGQPPPADPRLRASLPLNAVPMPVAIPGSLAVLSMNSHNHLVFSTDPKAPGATLTNWNAVFRYRFKDVQYDPASRYLTGTLTNQVPQQTYDRIYDLIRTQFSLPPGTPINISPVLAQSVGVELEWRGQRIEVRKMGSYETADGAFTIQYEVTDDKLHEFLSDKARFAYLPLKVVVVLPRAVIDRSRYSVDYTVSAMRQSLEQSVPKSTVDELLKGRPLLTDRAAAANLVGKSRDDFRAKVQGDPTRLAGMDAAFAKAMDRLSEPHLTPLYLLNKADLDSVQIWLPRIADVPGDDWKTSIVNHLKQSSEVWATLNTQWEAMKTSLSEAKSAKEWKTQATRKAGSGFNFGAVIKAIPINFGVTDTSESSRSGEGSEEQWAKAYEYAKAGGKLDQATFEKNYLEIAGDMRVGSVDPRWLKLVRVSGLDTLALRSAAFERETELSMGLYADEYGPELKPSHTMQQDALEELRLVKKRHTEDVAALNRRIDKLTEVVAANHEKAIAYSRELDAKHRTDRLGVDDEIRRGAKQYTDAEVAKAVAHTERVYQALADSIERKVGGFSERGRYWNTTLGGISTRIGFQDDGCLFVEYLMPDGKWRKHNLVSGHGP